MFKFNNKKDRDDVTAIVLVFFLTLNRLSQGSGVSIVDFEQVNAGWVQICLIYIQYS